MIILMRFVENVLCHKYIDIYEFRGVQGGDIHGPPNIFILLLKKNGKSTEA